MQKTRQGRTATTRHGAGGAGVENPRARQRALAISVVPTSPRDGDPLAELKELLRTAGVATAGELVQVRSSPDPDRYLGRGKLAELKGEIATSDANLVACDDELAPRQERNLEAALGVPVIDRTAVILDIFADHAHSAEGKLQVELAQLEYNLARMRGLWTHLERLGGGIGTRGPGETQIETDRRLARNRIANLRRRLGRLERNREVMRARRRGSALPTVALAGYTNAGKSTLLNALTGAGVGVGERLFHTLDPTTRAYRHRGRRYLVTDTVGFIRKLPHQLVEAFKATLEETVLADLIVHVVDASEPERRRREAIAAVSTSGNIEVLTAWLEARWSPATSSRTPPRTRSWPTCPARPGAVPQAHLLEAGRHTRGRERAQEIYAGARPIVPPRLATGRRPGPPRDVVLSVPSQCCVRLPLEVEVLVVPDRDHPFPVTWQRGRSRHSLRDRGTTRGRARQWRRGHRLCRCDPRSTRR